MVALALVGLAVIGMAVDGVVREVVADRRLRGWLRAHASRCDRGFSVIEDPRPRAFCAGLVRPRVYVSSGALVLLDDVALRAVVAHERAHARRRDPLCLACGRVLERALFYVPGLAALQRRRLELTELSADEQAIAAACGDAGHDPRSARVGVDPGAPPPRLRRRRRFVVGTELSSGSMARSRTPKPPPALHELEAEIMEEVWRQGEPTTVKLVMEALNRRAKPPRAYTTYMTVMRRLNDKGLLSRRRSGRSDTYEAALTREQYQDRRAGAEVRGLVDEFGDAALAHFARSLASLDPAQQRRLRRLASGE